MPTICLYSFCNGRILTHILSSKTAIKQITIQRGKFPTSILYLLYLIMFFMGLADEEVGNSVHKIIALHLN